MRYGTYTLTLPSNREYSVLQVKMLLNEIEHGIDRRITIKKNRIKSSTAKIEALKETIGRIENTMVYMKRALSQAES